MLFLDESANELLFVDLVLRLGVILVDLFLHDENGLMRAILDELILDIFEHHVESVFDVILSSARHFFYDFGPFVADAEPFLQDQDVLLQAEGVLLDLWVEEVDPSLSALLAVSVDVQALVQLSGDLRPLLGAV